MFPSHHTRPPITFQARWYWYQRQQFAKNFRHKLHFQIGNYRCHPRRILSIYFLRMERLLNDGFITGRSSYLKWRIRYCKCQQFGQSCRTLSWRRRLDLRAGLGRHDQRNMSNSILELDSLGDHYNKYYCPPRVRMKTDILRRCL